MSSTSKRFEHAISIVIPAYNEDRRIAPTLTQTLSYLEKHASAYEIIVVDDCSTDTTPAILASFKDRIRILRNTHNRGKGYSVKRGILAARHPLVLFMDSDLATPIEELDAFLPLIEHSDIVIASRNLKTSRIEVYQPYYRQILGRIYPLIVNVLLVPGIQDTQCGFKLFRTDLAQRIVRKQRMDGFSFDVEILLIARRHGYRITEAPVIWIDKPGSTVSTIKHGYHMLTDLARILIRDLDGAYSP